MKKKYFFEVMIPSTELQGPGSSRWISVDSFQSRVEAENFLKESWGINKENSKIFIQKTKIS